MSDAEKENLKKLLDLELDDLVVFAAGPLEKVRKVLAAYVFTSLPLHVLIYSARAPPSTNISKSK